jgi:hypothetical protein
MVILRMEKAGIVFNYSICLTNHLILSFRFLFIFGKIWISQKILQTKKLLIKCFKVLFQVFHNVCYQIDIYCYFVNVCFE